MLRIYYDSLHSILVWYTSSKDIAHAIRNDAGNVNCLKWSYVGSLFFLHGEVFINEVKQTADFASILNWHLSEFIKDF